MVHYTSYKLEDASDTRVLQVAGKLDSSNSGDLSECIDGHLEKGSKNIILDCSNLNAIASEGLAVLVRANTRLKKIGGNFALVGVKGTVAEVLRIVHFDRLFKIFATVDEAAAAFK
jgi:anti-anti-sigma factor